MNTFEEAFHVWRNAPFPRGTSNDAVDEIHADLVLYDAWVAESVLPFMDRGVWVPVVPDVLAALEDLTKRVEELRSGSTQDLDALLAYRAYADLLRTVYRAFLREGGSK